jgi:hypothetical protein
MNGKAFLFGLNYKNDPASALNGCINDVINMSAYLQKELGIPCELYTDDVNLHDTSARGMMNKFYEIALQTYRDNLDFVWIHYSGHGSYVRDTSGDEKDGRDECLVPNDYKTGGMILDDHVNHLFSYFNPKTRVICIFDCCHSGTIGDVKYSWEGPSSVTVENILCKSSARIITISGCLDKQVSMDAYNVMGDNSYSGAMTSCLLLALRENKTGCWNNAFTLISSLRTKLKERGFRQTAKMCSSYNLAKDPLFIPNV